jgi:hypothetical protein
MVPRRRAVPGVHSGTIPGGHPPGRAEARPRGQQAQALVELALAAPLLLMLAFGVVGLGRVAQGQLGVAAVAREAARAAALADTPAEALARGTARGQEVAVGYRLGNGSLALTVEPGALARGGQVRAVARYELALDDLPLMGWARVPVEGRHAERVDVWRSRWAEGGP